MDFFPPPVQLILKSLGKLNTKNLHLADPGRQFRDAEFGERFHWSDTAVIEDIAENLFNGGDLDETL